MERTLGGRSGIPVRPVPAADRGVRDRHAAAHRVRVAARRARVLVHAHRHHGPVPADDRQGGLLPARLGRQRAAHRAAGAERLRGALRPVGALRPGLHAAGEAGQDRGARLPAQLHRAVRAAHRDRRARLRGPVAARRPFGRLVAALHDDQRRHPAGVAAGVPAQPRPGRGVPGRGAHAVGRHVPDGGRPGGARGPRLRRRVPPDLLPRARRLPGVGRDDPARAAARLRGAGRAPGRPALPGAVRRHGADAGVRRRGAGLRAPARRAGQGVGHRDGVHLRRPDRRDLVAGARPADAGDHRAERAAARRPAGRGARRRRTPSWPARPCSPRARGWSSCCGKAATSTASRGR